MNKEALKAEIENIKKQQQQHLQLFHEATGAIAALEFVLNNMPDELPAENEEVQK